MLKHHLVTGSVVITLLLIGTALLFFPSHHPQPSFPVQAQTSPGSWLQLQNGPDRLGHSTENLTGPLTKVWAHGFSPEKLQPQIQPIVAQNQVFIGTRMGTMYAFNAQTGSLVWQQTLGPIEGTPGIDNNLIIIPSLDTHIYALDISDGHTVWDFNSHHRAGFSTSVLIANHIAYVANRAGVYYALDTATGNLIWQHDYQVPILMASAFAGNRLFFGAQDMRVHAIDAQSGNILWQTAPGQVWGLAFKDFWPIAYQNRVYILPAKAEGGTTGSPALPRVTGPLSQTDLDNQAQVIQNYQQNPHTQSLYVFDQQTGQQTIVPHYVGMAMNGAVCPPSVDGDGQLIIPVLWDGIFGSGWGRYNPSLNRITEVLWDGTNMTGNPDENLCTSTAGRLVFAMHIEEGNAQYTGYWNLDTRQATVIPAYQADHNYFFNQTQSLGASPAAFAGGMIFHVTENTLNARRAASY